MSGRKVIISCAITGSIHTPSMSPHLPVTAAEIAESALAAAEARGENGQLNRWGKTKCQIGFDGGQGGDRAARDSRVRWEGAVWAENGVH